VELLPSVVWTSLSTPEQRVFAHVARRSPCTKTQSVALTNFFVAQTVTIGVATAGAFLFHLEFWDFIKNWGLFDPGQILEMYVVLPYFPIRNTVLS